MARITPMYQPCRPFTNPSPWLRKPRIHPNCDSRRVFFRASPGDVEIRQKLTCCHLFVVHRNKDVAERNGVMMHRKQTIVLRKQKVQYL